MANPGDAAKDGNPLEQTWCDTRWIPFLSIANVMEYFSSPTNPFYDKECNNEVVRMQRLDPSTLKTMTGVEYELIHAKDPILFVIRKQHRTSPTSVSPISSYYILGGHIHQAPDLWTIINSRLLNTCYQLQRSFDELHNAVRFHTHSGYSFQLKNAQTGNTATFRSDVTSARANTDAGDYGTQFQRNSVSAIIDRVIRKHASSLMSADGDGSGSTTASNTNSAGEQMDISSDQRPEQVVGLNFSTGGNKNPLAPDASEAGENDLKTKRQRI